MTAGFLGSQGEAFGDRLSQQRPNMDAAVEAFFQPVSYTHLTLPTTPYV